MQKDKTFVLNQQMDALSMKARLSSDTRLGSYTPDPLPLGALHEESVLDTTLQPHEVLPLEANLTKAAADALYTAHLESTSTVCDTQELVEDEKILGFEGA